MKDSIKNRKKQFLALCLSAMMLSSAAAFAACSDSSSDSSSSSSSSTTTQEKDTGLIQNAGFEKVSGSNLITTSVSDWTNAKTSDSNGSANTSTAASGIVDLNEDAWKDLTTSTYVAANADDAKANWKNMTTKDKLAFYKKWKDENSGKTISTELKDFYESFNIDDGDTFEMDHFDTHDGQAAQYKTAKNEGKSEDELADFDTKVLMIHNQYSENNTVGTGQKYTSSSTVTVKAGTSAKFSVWVKTKDLQSASSDNVAQEAVNKGAFISVTHSVGGATLDEYKVENINTEAMGVTDNNGWKQYTFLLKGSSYTDSTFKMVLGLGQGSTYYRAEYVNGFAFFDDIQCEVISNADCDGVTAHHTANFENEGDEKVVNVYENTSFNTFKLDFYGDFTATEGGNEVLNGVTAEDTRGEIGLPGNKISYTSKHYENPTSTDPKLAPGLKAGIVGDNDITAVVNGVKTDGNPDSLISKVADKYFKNPTLFADAPTLLLLSENGVAYTAKSAKEFTLDTDKYLAVSFFVKTSAMNDKVGAGVTLSVKDSDTTIAFSSIDTTKETPVKINDEDIYEGWQKYFFFVENASESNKNLTLSFNFGPTEITSSLTESNFASGFAAFTNFETKEMSKEEFLSAQDGTYAKVLSITEDTEEDNATGGFATAMGTPSDAIEKGLAQLSNHKGVYSDSQYLDSTNADATYNTYENAGLVSKKYFEDYFADTDKAWLTGIKAASSETTADGVWADIFGNDTSMPLLIWNDGSAKQLEKSYGYISASNTISTNSYSAISIRVKGTDGAKAYIRLTDTDEENFNEVLTIDRNLTYWYDDNGNIYDGDPAKTTSKLAFKLQSNGLYKASEKWSGYDSLGDNKNAYFANLNAYEKDADGNLKVAKGGAQHDYNEHYDNEGLDGIAFYAKDGAFYADRATTVKVLNLADITSLTPRYAASEEKKLESEVTLSSDWKYVTFFIHTGDVAKNYRLEVFSGDKNGDANDANSYVVFDTIDFGTAQDNFTGLLADEDYTNAATAKEESVFSYFDAASYLRYDATLDENGIGNLYEENYTATAQEEGISYLLYDAGDEYSVFADYSYTEKTVTASEKDDDAEDDSSSEDDTAGETNVWLLASSLAVAGVLLLAIVSIVVRKAITSARKKRTAQNSPKAKK